MNTLARHRRIIGNVRHATPLVMKRVLETPRRSLSALDTVPLVVVDPWEVEHLAGVRPHGAVPDSPPFPYGNDMISITPRIAINGFGQAVSVEEVNRTMQDDRDGMKGILSYSAVVDRLWCPALLPDGTQGHWFFTQAGSSLIWRDPACPSHGQVVHQCPVHRGFLGSISAGSTRREREVCR